MHDKLFAELNMSLVEHNGLKAYIDRLKGIQKHCWVF
jgi:hypothetical protein